MRAAKKNFNLEKSLSDLEDLVDELESGDLPLEKAMKKFEEGIKLTRGCQTALKEAEQKVEILLKTAGGEDLEDFETDESQYAGGRSRVDRPSKSRSATNRRFHCRSPFDLPSILNNGE